MSTPNQRERGREREREAEAEAERDLGRVVALRAFVHDISLSKFSSSVSTLPSRSEIYLEYSIPGVKAFPPFQTERSITGSKIVFLTKKKAQWTEKPAKKLKNQRLLVELKKVVKKKGVTVARGLVELYALATGPARQEVELFEVNVKLKTVTTTRVCMAGFTFELEEVYMPTLTVSLEIDSGGMPPSGSLLAQATIFPSKEIAESVPKTKEEKKAIRDFPTSSSQPLSSSRWRHNLDLPMMKFTTPHTNTELAASVMRLTLVPTTSSNDRLANAVSIVPLTKLLNFDPESATVNFECTLRQAMALVARVQVTFRWKKMPRLVQMIGGYHHSKKGIIGAELVKHVLPPPDELFKSRNKVVLHEEIVDEIERDEADGDIAGIDSSGEQSEEANPLGSEDVALKARSPREKPQKVVPVDCSLCKGKFDPEDIRFARNGHQLCRDCTDLYYGRLGKKETPCGLCKTPSYPHELEELSGLSFCSNCAPRVKERMAAKGITPTKRAITRTKSTKTKTKTKSRRTPSKRLSVSPSPSSPAPLHSSPSPAPSPAPSPSKVILPAPPAPVQMESNENDVDDFLAFLVDEPETPELSSESQSLGNIDQLLSEVNVTVKMASPRGHHQRAISDISETELEGLLLPALPTQTVSLPAHSETQPSFTQVAQPKRASRELPPPAISATGKRQAQSTSHNAAYTKAATPQPTTSYDINSLVDEMEANVVPTSTAKNRAGKPNNMTRSQSQFASAAQMLDAGGKAKKEQLRKANESTSPRRTSTWSQEGKKLSKLQRSKTRAARASVQLENVDWKCHSCGVENKGKLARCTMCGASRPAAKTIKRVAASNRARLNSGATPERLKGPRESRSPSKMTKEERKEEKRKAKEAAAAAAAAAALLVPASPRKWRCERCTTRNPYTNTKACNMCGAPPPLSIRKTTTPTPTTITTTTSSSTTTTTTTTTPSRPRATSSGSPSTVSPGTRRLQPRSTLPPSAFSPGLATSVENEYWECTSCGYPLNPSDAQDCLTCQAPSPLGPTLPVPATTSSLLRPTQTMRVTGNVNIVQSSAPQYQLGVMGQGQGQRQGQVMGTNGMMMGNQLSMNNMNLGMGMQQNVNMNTPQVTLPMNNSMNGMQGNNMMMNQMGMPMINMGMGTNNSNNINPLTQMNRMNMMQLQQQTLMQQQQQQPAMGMGMNMGMNMNMGMGAGVGQGMRPGGVNAPQTFLFSSSNPQTVPKSGTFTPVD